MLNYKRHFVLLNYEISYLQFCCLSTIFSLRLSFYVVQYLPKQLSAGVDLNFSLHIACSKTAYYQIKPLFFFLKVVMDDSRQIDRITIYKNQLIIHVLVISIHQTWNHKHETFTFYKKNNFVLVPRLTGTAEETTNWQNCVNNLKNIFSKNKIRVSKYSVSLRSLLKFVSVDFKGNEYT